MNVYYPAYYKDFRCLAGACPDSCCKEWTVDVDPASAAFYRQLPGDLGDRLRSVLSEEDGVTIMTIEDGRCPMWRQDGLCRIQAELGHDALCQTCRDYPRLRHDYGDFVELGLELSCPEAARLILSGTSEIICDTRPGGDTGEYDSEVMATLLKSRQAVLDFLDSGHPLPKKLAAILLYAHSIQAELDGAEPQPLNPADCLAAADRYAGNGDMEAVFAFFRELEILTSRWQDLLDRGPKDILWSPQLQAVARYLVQRYWLQAVSDFDLVCRVKLILVSCLLVGALDDYLSHTAQLFSKEIENDPDNIEAILDGAYTAPALTDANLLALLLAKNAKNP